MNSMISFQNDWTVFFTRRSPLGAGTRGADLLAGDRPPDPPPARRARIGTLATRAVADAALSALGRVAAARRPASRNNAGGIHIVQAVIMHSAAADDADRRGRPHHAGRAGRRESFADVSQERAGETVRTLLSGDLRAGRARELAELAVDDTGLGNVPDKVVKNSARPLAPCAIFAAAR